MLTDTAGVEITTAPAAWPAAGGPAAEPVWWVLSLATVAGHLVLLQDTPAADWMVWCGPSAPDAAVSSLTYRDPRTGARTAAPVAVFRSPADATAAWRGYLHGRPSRRPRVLPHAVRVAALPAIAADFGAVLPAHAAAL